MQVARNLVTVIEEVIRRTEFIDQTIELVVFGSQSYAGQTASSDVDLKLMLVSADVEEGVKILKRVKETLRSQEGFAELDRSVDALESYENRVKCMFEAKFGGMEFDLSFAHEGSSSHRAHELLSAGMRKAISDLDPHRIALCSCSLILK